MRISLSPCVVVPAVVHEGDAAVDGRADDPQAFGRIFLSPDVGAAQSNHRHLLPGSSQRAIQHGAARCFHVLAYPGLGGHDGLECPEELIGGEGQGGRGRRFQKFASFHGSFLWALKCRFLRVFQQHAYRVGEQRRFTVAAKDCTDTGRHPEPSLRSG